MKRLGSQSSRCTVRLRETFSSDDLAYLVVTLDLDRPKPAHVRPWAMAGVFGVWIVSAEKP